jgi:hypothetical protein
MDYAKVRSYTLVDLPDPLLLTEKWLERNGIYLNVNFRSHLDKSNIEYDLCISNYAFTEFDGDIQEHYVNSILKKSKHGFIICNFFTGPDQGASVMSTLLGHKKGKFKIMDEIPRTDIHNFVYIW